MTISEALLAEFDEEMASTRKILLRIPQEKFDWSPHEKSSTLGKLANHLANIPGWAVAIIDGHAQKQPEAVSKADLLDAMDKSVAAGRAAIENASDERLGETLAVTSLSRMTRVAILRRMLLGHTIHHRGQLSVYLRLLDIAVPGIYGPSADESREPEFES
jgi:uncharacterized damage-inducible protein DinB